ncbi:putative nucleic acid-binding protein [Arabidopsis thaliana]|uniref:F11M21.26 protein n=3 Tax=Arabidopsis TaxID=3701 RepID=Q9ZWA3_ARATH|nr:Nucleic acid-binding, OB-fold-like protein [Arabidopsis thaliana]KAG7644978.1 Nucleic acid-binding OB-fold [Arabidopsis thaliana x Arabidopsis arenosa]AAD10687.1 Hypothetical protein [Arabidopsis thaliana]AEE27616.1 Nucleic acid-binding, OB-fold-like protein [Arabidopsis thaliana]OAP15121.1 hypothetical protein AXX17_AT1G03070 [Arabidopsis thaliana]CAD5311650.1 unnamed protein product [Arabidopsis thaliana]|eukprot:NP_171877.1 Nucleic acid-binding, OB-fold-like protein [Arabidopsis thaliana]
MSTTANTNATTAPKRKPVFVKVDQLKPGTSGHTLIVKVLESNPVKPAIRKSSLTQQPISSPRIAECLIGDDTGCILFTARNDQVDLMKTGATVILRNAKIDLFKDTMRMAVDRWGRIEITGPVSFEVNRANNLSLVEYEVITA